MITQALWKLSGANSSRRAVLTFTRGFFASKWALSFVPIMHRGAGILAIAVALLCMGCEAVLRKGTQESGYVLLGTHDRKTNLTMSIRQVIDDRPARQITDWRMGFLIFLPLVPYLSTESMRHEDLIGEQIKEYGDSLEKSRLDQFSLMRTMTQIIASDIQSSEAFSDVRIVATDRDVREDLCLSIRVNGLRRVTRQTSYLLGLGGCYLWFLGLPAVCTFGEMDVTASVTTPSGRILWEEQLMSRKSSGWMGIYSRREITAASEEESEAPEFGVLEYQYIDPRPDGVDARCYYYWEMAALREMMKVARPKIIEAASKYETELAQPPRDD